MASVLVGTKDLEYIPKTRLQQGEILFGEEVYGLYSRSHMVTVNLFLEAAANSGKGGTWTHVLKGEGLYDPVDAWNQPKGNMTVKVSWYVLLVWGARQQLAVPGDNSKR